MTEIAEILARPRQPGPRYIIDPVAFFLALIGGPLLFTLATFWALFIPVLAVVFGGQVYLLMGTPLLLVHLGRHAPDPWRIGALAIKANLAMLALCILFGLATGNDDAIGLGIGFTLFGLFFGPCWAVTFGWLYRNLCRDFYTHPIPD